MLETVSYQDNVALFCGSVADAGKGNIVLTCGAFAAPGLNDKPLPP
jgi:hypothetical protein